MDEHKSILRKAKPSDAEAIAAMGAAVFTATFGHSVPPQDLQSYLDETYSLDAIAEYLAHPEKDTIVATDERGRIQGYVTLAHGTSEPCVEDLESKAELERLYVDVSAHGKGVGSLLARAIEQLARDAGYKNMWLGVWEENEKATKMYEKWGYRMVGDHDFRLGTVVQTDNIMTKAL